MEAKPLDCPICKEAETFADQLEREMEEAETKSREAVAKLSWEVQAAIKGVEAE